MDFKKRVKSACFLCGLLQSAGFSIVHQLAALAPAQVIINVFQVEVRILNDQIIKNSQSARIALDRWMLRQASQDMIWGPDRLIK
jgi:hypothetical protein